MKCPTVSGRYRCKHDAGHRGECEADDASRRIALGPYRDMLRTVAYVRGAIDFGAGEMLNVVGRYVGCERRDDEDDCHYRARLTRALP